MPLGWFAPGQNDRVPQGTAFMILIGNAGPEMFRRFSRERTPALATLDAWTKATVDVLAEDLSATAIYPFDTPPAPFLTWARAANAGHISPLGLNIHPTYGLWHAYRAALLFPVAFDLPRLSAGAHPCESCAEKPCLSSCPVGAFDGTGYDYKSCGRHVLSEAGQDCMTGGCLARLACPVGRGYAYAPAQMQFHMRAFAEARKKDS